MSKSIATISWRRDDQAFTDNQYERAHQWRFEGGISVPASSSPDIIPVPLSDPTAVDPEEAFVASISSCHMLWFLSIAAKRSFIVDEYNDRAEGRMELNDGGCMAITEVFLRPVVTYEISAAPSPEENVAIHRNAHEQCFIANSVRSAIQIAPTMR